MVAGLYQGGESQPQLLTCAKVQHDSERCLEGVALTAVWGPNATLALRHSTGGFLGVCSGDAGALAAVGCLLLATRPVAGLCISVRYVVMLALHDEGNRSSCQLCSGCGELHNCYPCLSSRIVRSSAFPNSVYQHWHGSSLNWVYPLGSKKMVCSRLWREAVHLCWEMRLHLRAHERCLSVISCIVGRDCMLNDALCGISSFHAVAGRTRGSQRVRPDTMALGATINVCADSVKVDEGGFAMLAACANSITCIVRASGSPAPGSWAFALGLFGEAKLRSASTHRAEVYDCIRDCE